MPLDISAFVSFHPCCIEGSFGTISYSSLLYFYSSVLQGKTSHKFVDLSSNPIMSIYYSNRTVLFFMCAGNEAFYCSLYLLHFAPGPISTYAQNAFSFTSNIYIVQIITRIYANSCRYRVIQTRRICLRTCSYSQNTAITSAWLRRLPKFGHNRYQRKGTTNEKEGIRFKYEVTSHVCLSFPFLFLLKVRKY